jgi:hypothetical protein
MLPMVRGSNPDRCKEFFSFPKHPDLLWGPPSSLFNYYCRGPFLVIKLPGRERDHSPPPSVQVKNDVAILLSLYVYNAWTRTLYRGPVSCFGNFKHSDSGLFFSVSVHKMWDVNPKRAAAL